MAVLSTLPPTALPALKQVHALLHLTHHRNKNQHRLAKWWGALSMLRRNVDKLVLELEALESLGTGKTAKKERREAEAKVQQRVEFLRDVLVERTYLAFSNLVADNQYAALGLMLLATLARMNRVISPLALKAIVTEPVLKEGLVASSAPDGDVVAREDFGERIERGAPTSTKEGNITPKSDNKAAKKRGFATEETAMNKQVQASATPKPPKKKRKKGDAFDDLFSGLM